MMPCGVLLDQFGNILLDSLDIIEAIFPFYNFHVKGIKPKIAISYPYGIDKKTYFKNNKANSKLFRDEIQLSKDEY